MKTEIEERFEELIRENEEELERLGNIHYVPQDYQFVKNKMLYLEKLIAKDKVLLKSLKVDGLKSEVESETRAELKKLIQGTIKELDRLKALPEVVKNLPEVRDRILAIERSVKIDRRVTGL